MIQFVKDRAAQGSITGPYRPVADQTKFRSIYAVVDGPQGNHPWTGQMVEGGEIFSADGKLRMGGVPAKDPSGSFHDVKSGNTVLREYQIPVQEVEKWNRYEAAQALLQEKMITADKNVQELISRIPVEYRVDTEEGYEEQAVDYGNQPVATTASKTRKQASQKQIDSMARARQAAANKRAAAKLAPVPT